MKHLASPMVFSAGFAFLSPRRLAERPSTGLADKWPRQNSTRSAWIGRHATGLHRIEGKQPHKLIIYRRVEVRLSPDAGVGIVTGWQRRAMGGTVEHVL